MRPTLLSIPDVPLLGDLDFHAYAVFLALAFLFGVLLPVRQNYQLPNPHPITPLGGIWVFFGAMIGAKLYWILQYGNPADFLSAAIFWKGGLVFYGGLIGGVLGGIAYLKAVGAPILPVGDLAMPFVALAHAIARIGCFLNGCCWGSRTDLPWAVHYPKTPGIWPMDSIPGTDGSRRTRSGLRGSTRRRSTKRSG